MRTTTAFLFALALAACGNNGTTTTTPDMSVSSSKDMATAPADMGPYSICGHPGDKGNSKGVGQFCNTISDCTGEANLCATLGDPNAHFCTLTPCSPDGGASECGEDAVCQCVAGQGCGCAPTSCTLGDGGI